MDLDRIDNWSRLETLALIRELQKRPCLYNPLDPQFLNKSKKLTAMQQIFENLITMDMIKKKLRTLQSQVSREKKNIRNSKRSGCGADEVYESTLWCFNELSFLINLNDTVPSSSNLDLTQFQFYNDIESATEAEECNIPKKKTKKKSPEKIKARAINVLEKASNILEESNQPPSKSRDFCNYLCGLLEQFQLEETLVDATIDILSIVKNHIKAESEKLESKKTQPKKMVTQPIRIKPQSSSSPISSVEYTTSGTTSPAPSAYSSLGTSSTYCSSAELEKNLENKKIKVLDVKIIKQENSNSNKNNKNTLQLAFEQTFESEEELAYYTDTF